MAARLFGYHGRMSKLIILIQNYGLLIVFGTVLLEQIGLPIPAYPVLIVAGALAVDGQASWSLVLAVALAACLISDYFWFRAGQFYGKRILRLLCRISLSPDSCVNQTEDNFRRFGPNSLVVAKFIPGFNTIAPPLAGAMGTSALRFLALSLAGALLWSGAGIGLGAYFHASVEQVLALFDEMGSAALALLLALLVLFILFKYAERRRLREFLLIERIDIGELMRLIEDGHDPLIIDARSVTAQQMEPPIPGALMLSSTEPTLLMDGLDKDRHIVVYCSCPNDITAAQVAKQFLANGFHLTRPLQGGLDAWKAHRDGGASQPGAGQC
jgi:membrane protein DedA with SNARE-associated domain/rhodanese-related sulfurtransferase